METMDLSKMMTKHKYRSWYMKIHANISKHGFWYIREHVDETNHCSFLSEFGQRCEDCYYYIKYAVTFDHKDFEAGFLNRAWSKLVK